MIDTNSQQQKDITDNMENKVNDVKADIEAGRFYLFLSQKLAEQRRKGELEEDFRNGYTNDFFDEYAIIVNYDLEKQRFVKLNKGSYYQWAEKDKTKFQQYSELLRQEREKKNDETINEFKVDFRDHMYIKQGYNSNIWFNVIYFNDPQHENLVDEMYKNHILFYGKDNLMCSFEEFLDYSFDDIVCFLDDIFNKHKEVLENPDYFLNKEEISKITLYNEKIQELLKQLSSCKEKRANLPLKEFCTAAIDGEDDKFLYKMLDVIKCRKCTYVNTILNSLKDVLQTFIPKGLTYKDINASQRSQVCQRFYAIEVIKRIQNMLTYDNTGQNKELKYDNIKQDEKLQIDQNFSKLIYRFLLNDRYFNSLDNLFSFSMKKIRKFFTDIKEYNLDCKNCFLSEEEISKFNKLYDEWFFFNGKRGIIPQDAPYEKVLKEFCEKAIDGEDALLDMFEIIKIANDDVVYEVLDELRDFLEKIVAKKSSKQEQEANENRCNVINFIKMIQNIHRANQYDEAQLPEKRAYTKIHPENQYDEAQLLEQQIYQKLSNGKIICLEELFELSINDVRDFLNNITNVRPYSEVFSYPNYFLSKKDILIIKLYNDKLKQIDAKLGMLDATDEKDLKEKLKTICDKAIDGKSVKKDINEIKTFITEDKVKNVFQALQELFQTTIKEGFVFKNNENVFETIKLLEAIQNYDKKNIDEALQNKQQELQSCWSLIRKYRINRKIDRLNLMLEEPIYYNKEHIKSINQHTPNGLEKCACQFIQAWEVD